MGCRETWSQEQCWFSGQHYGSKSHKDLQQLACISPHWFPVSLSTLRVCVQSEITCMFLCPALTPFAWLCGCTCPSMCCMMTQVGPRVVAGQCFLLNLMGFYVPRAPPLAALSLTSATQCQAFSLAATQQKNSGLTAPS